MSSEFIITTQNLWEPYEWGGFVWATITEGLHAGTDWMAQWKNLLGGRVKGFEKKIDVAIAAGKEKLERSARTMGCNAIIGLRINVEAIPVGGEAVVTVSLYGAAVKRSKRVPPETISAEQDFETSQPETVHGRFPGRFNISSKNPHPKNRGT